jgi:hypothetical protein
MSNIQSRTKVEQCFFANVSPVEILLFLWFTIKIFIVYYVFCVAYFYHINLIFLVGVGP